MWARSCSKNNVSCDTFDSSHDEHCLTTCAIPLRAGKHPSPCELVFPLLCSQSVPSYDSVLTDAAVGRMWRWRKNASCVGVHNASPCFFSGFGAHSTCSDAECVGGLRQERFRFNPANATQRPTQSLERHSLLLFRLGHKNKRNDSSLIDPSQSHTAHAHDVEKNLDYAGAVVCDSMHAATSALAWVVAAVEHCKANTSLTKLSLVDNKVGDAGATALADALQATVLTCGQQLFRACAGCCNGCRFS